MKNDIKRIAVLVAAFLVSAGATAAVHASAINVTEWAYQGSSGEFVELTNTSASPVDLTGWSFNDDHAIASTTDPTNPAVDLSSFGVVQPHESVLIVGDATATPAVTPATFRAAWGLPASVKILSSGSIGFGRNDAFNVYDASGTNVESFAFGDQNYAGTVRTQNVSANVPLSGLDSAMALADMPKSLVGDAYGSYASSGGDVGNPGSYVTPEPTALAGLIATGAIVARRRRR